MNLIASDACHRYEGLDVVVRNLFGDETLDAIACNWAMVEEWRHGRARCRNRRERSKVSQPPAPGSVPLSVMEEAYPMRRPNVYPPPTFREGGPLRLLLFLLISASLYKPYGLATSLHASLVPPLADSLRAAM